MGHFSSWARIPEYIDPVALSVGPVQIRWYGLMYVFAFLTVYYLVLYRIRKEKLSYSDETISDFFTWGILGVLLGGRLGYVLFYNFNYFLSNPLEIFIPFSFSEGIQYIGIYGMSYHGGLLGVVLAFILFCRKKNINIWNFGDLFVSAIPLGYTFGRLGNFINGELYGRITTVSWGMYFPFDPSRQLRHPSQLYEALFEGVFLFVIVWSLRKVKYFEGFLCAVYIFGYGFVRFFIEFAREPDGHLGFILGPLTTGQVLCLIMMAAGAGIYWKRKVVCRGS